MINVYRRKVGEREKRKEGGEGGRKIDVVTNCYSFTFIISRKKGMHVTKL